MAEFLERLRDTILLCDGAMGTVLYSKGVFINRCFEELNLSDPDLVRDVHRDYVRAGVDILETNTFGANRIRLRQQELDDRLENINRKAVELARSEAEAGILVAGSIGPTGRTQGPNENLSPDEVESAFREQASVLARAGVDLFILETFHRLEEILIAIRSVKEETGLPVVAQVAFDREGLLADGHSPEEAVRELSASPADVVGTNCGLGPRQTYEIIRRFQGLTKKTISAQPNAGFPEEIGGRTLYLNTPEYMATYAQHMIRAGVRLVGGCCGSTPAHIRAVRGSVRMLAHGRLVVHTSEPREHEEAKEEIPLADRSPLAARFARGERVCSVEVAPPRGVNPARFLDSCRALRDAGVHLVNIPDGPRAVARMANMLAALLVKEQVGIESIQHFCSRDRNLLGIQSYLLGAHAVGLHNVLFITGDPPKMGDYPEATAVFDVDSIGMIRIARNLNRGLDMGGKPIGDQTHFFIATGAEPAAFDIDEEIRRLHSKVESGAEVVFTQPVYDLDTMDKFLDLIKDLSVPR